MGELDACDKNDRRALGQITEIVALALFTRETGPRRPPHLPKPCGAIGPSRATRPIAMKPSRSPASRPRENTMNAGDIFRIPEPGTA